MTATPRLPLNALRVLQAVARHGSMARAAEALNVEPSAVSMHVKALADFVGSPMVVRSGRGVELTSAARALLPAIATGLDLIEGALDAARQKAGARPFVVSLLPSVLLLCLVPILPTIEQAAHGRRVMFTPDKQLADLAAQAADAAIRLGRGAWPGALARKLGDEFLVPVCAPHLRTQVGRLQQGELPAGVPLLSSHLDGWELWSPGGTRARALVVDDAVAVVMQAQLGHGVALSRLSLVRQSVRAGRLVEVGPRIPYRAAYYWVTPLAGDGGGLADQLYEILSSVFDDRSAPAA